jgi:hypothetical protein
MPGGYGLIKTICMDGSSWRSKNAFLLDFDVEEAVLFGIAFEEFAEVVAGPADLVADLQEEALLIIHLQDLQPDVFEQH